MQSKSNIKRYIFRSDRILKAYEKKYKGLIHEALKEQAKYAINHNFEIKDTLTPVIERLYEDVGIRMYEYQYKLLEGTIAVQNQQIAEMKPKVSYYDVVLNCKDLISTSALAKDYGKSAIWMNRYLHDKGIQFKQGDIWLLYQKYAEKGYTSTKTHSYLGSNGEQHTKVHTYWTQKGRLFIYELMKADGILPQIETEGV